MPPTIAYWTTQYRPADEAISKEIAALAEVRRESQIYCFSAQHFLRHIPSERCWHIGRGLYPLARLAAPWLAGRFDVQHLFIESGHWHLLRMLGRRPLVATVVSDSGGVSPLLAQASLVVAEDPALAEKLAASGIPPDKLRIIPPGTALGAVPPLPACPPLRLLFASSPPAEDPPESRGLDVLLAAVAASPAVELTILWRAWSGPAARLEPLLAQFGRERVRIVVESTDVPGEFARAHVVAAPFRQGKAFPNSVVEGLSAARPAIVSAQLARIAETGGGAILVAPLEKEAWARAFADVAQRLSELSQLARRAAEAQFSLAAWLRAYEEVYAAALARSGERSAEAGR